MIQYQLLGGTQRDMSISGLVQRAQVHGGGPAPFLSPGGGQTMVGQGQSSVINFGAAAHRTVAIPLLTCAGVILTSTDPNAAAQAVVYHATAGDIPNGMLALLHAAIGAPPLASLLAVYATPKPWDANYNADALKLQTFGIPANRVVYIEQIPASTFGINSHGQVGC